MEEIMAEEVTYPVLPVSRWWSLRKKFKQSLPANLTPSTLAVMLGMEERSAKLNVYHQLIRLGLIDKDGKVNSALANKWREDEHYSDVCRQIRESIYPKELLDIAPGPTINRNEVARWFRLNASVGESAANKMAGIYELLAEADAGKSQDDHNTPSRRDSTIIRKNNKSNKPGASELKSPKPLEKSLTVVGSGLGEPSVHIDIQVHISPDATAEQIDQVFESMAKHLYPKRD